MCSNPGTSQGLQQEYKLARSQLSISLSMQEVEKYFTKTVVIKKLKNIPPAALLPMLPRPPDPAPAPKKGNKVSGGKPPIQAKPNIDENKENEGPPTIFKKIVTEGHEFIKWLEDEQQRQLSENQNSNEQDAEKRSPPEILEKRETKGPELIKVEEDRQNQSKSGNQGAAEKNANETKGPSQETVNKGETQFPKKYGGWHNKYKSGHQHNARNNGNEHKGCQSENSKNKDTQGREYPRRQWGGQNKFKSVNQSANERKWSPETIKKREPEGRELAKKDEDKEHNGKCGHQDGKETKGSQAVVVKKTDEQGLLKYSVRIPPNIIDNARLSSSVLACGILMTVAVKRIFGK